MRQPAALGCSILLRHSRLSVVMLEIKETCTPHSIETIESCVAECVNVIDDVEHSGRFSISLHCTVLHILSFHGFCLTVCCGGKAAEMVAKAVPLVVEPALYCEHVSKVKNHVIHLEIIWVLHPTPICLKTSRHLPVALSPHNISWHPL